MGTQMFPAIKRHLIHDEIETIHPNRKIADPVTCRIRVWMARSATPIALVTEVEPLGLSRISTTGIANYILSGILRHRSEGVAYFEDEPLSTGKLHLVSFDYAGCISRLHAFNPQYGELPWERFESGILGQPIDR